MTSYDPTVRVLAAPASLRAALPLFAVTLFISALLLFAIQPMFTKMVLPILGGSPSVWSVAMVFFQAALLIGYAYAHFISRRLTVLQAALAHLALLAAAAFTLPIGVASGLGEPPSDGVGFWLVGLFAASIGLPFVALSASAPLLQNWFGTSGHPQAQNPYVLYAASNLGSFAALLTYPLLIEPLLSLRAQAWTWSVGYAGLAVLVAAAALIAARGGNSVAAVKTAAAVSPTARQRLIWIALAAIPAGLVVGATAYISTDVAAAPLLWVLPLALYLLTFVAAFRERPWLPHNFVVGAVPFLVAPLAISLLAGEPQFWIASIVLNLLALFALALVCHRELYVRRPPAALLTEFYLWTSLGGVIGGIFAGLLAPLIFNQTYEYPILIVAALFALPGAFAGGNRFVVRIWPALAVTALAIVLPFVVDLRLGVQAVLPFKVALIVLATVMLLQRRDAARFASLAVVAFVASGAWQPGTQAIERTRSFFGVHQVKEIGTHRTLVHGTTIHGAERIRNADGSLTTGRPEPLTYYYFGGPISEGIKSARAAHALNSVAVVGLGAGSLACHAQGGEKWTFFEIDPEVVRIARDPKFFRFMSTCAPDANVVLGDARLTLAKSTERFDLIVLDAFSSDAIPIHLLTREAMRAYLAHLSPHGTVLIHISNRHMELGRVVAAVGAAEGLTTFVKADGNDTFQDDFRAAALVAVLGRDVADLGALPSTPGWQKTAPDGVSAWTDDYSNIIAAIIRKKLEH